MTTITIDDDMKFNKTHFDNSMELLEFLSEKFGIKTTWTVSDQDVPKDDISTIQKARKTSWDELDNI